MPLACVKLTEKLSAEPWAGLDEHWTLLRGGENTELIKLLIVSHFPWSLTIDNFLLQLNFTNL